MKLKLGLNPTTVGLWAILFVVLSPTLHAYDITNKEQVIIDTITSLDDFSLIKPLFSRAHHTTQKFHAQSKAKIIFLLKIYNHLATYYDTYPSEKINTILTLIENNLSLVNKNIAKLIALQRESKKYPSLKYNDYPQQNYYDQPPHYGPEPHYNNQPPQNHNNYPPPQPPDTQQEMAMMDLLSSLEAPSGALTQIVNPNKWLTFKIVAGVTIAAIVVVLAIVGGLFFYFKILPDLIKMASEPVKEHIKDMSKLIDEQTNNLDKLEKKASNELLPKLKQAETQISKNKKALTSFTAMMGNATSMIELFKTEQIEILKKQQQSLEIVDQEFKALTKLQKKDSTALFQLRKKDHKDLKLIINALDLWKKNQEALAKTIASLELSTNSRLYALETDHKVNMMLLDNDLFRQQILVKLEKRMQAIERKVLGKEQEKFTRRSIRKLLKKKTSKRDKKNVD